MSYFGRNLRFLRTQQNLDLPGFARQVDLWEDTLRRYENEKAEPDLDTLVSIAEKLQLPVDHLLRRDLELLQNRIRSRNIKLILLDVDGTLSDGGMYYSESGDQMKRFDSKDGLAIYRLIKRQGIHFGFVSSGSTSTIMQNRAETLGVTRLYFGTQPKLEIIDIWLAELKLGYQHVAYVGDDLNDLPVIKKVGVSACPADAVHPVKVAAQVVLRRKGGQGCVREFLEEVLGFNIS